MRTTFLALAAALVLTLATLPISTQQAAADGCYICTSGSACGQYCRYSGSDNGDNRKKCRKAGCKIGGTASCPTGANIKVCTGSLIRKQPKYAWLDDLLRFSGTTTAIRARSAAW